MRTVEMLIGGLIGLTALAVILRGGGQAANNVLQGFASFNRETFGTFLQG